MDGDVPRIANRVLQDSVDNVIMQVNQDNVLGVRKVLLEEAERLDEAINDAVYAPASPPLSGRMGEPGHGVWVGRCSDDPISGPAQISFNRKIAAAIEQCRDYVDGLGVAGEQLGVVAQQYGFTEDEIQAHPRSFSR